MIHTIRIGALEYLAAGNIDAPHCFTTRHGGVSTGNLSSMNLRISRGDTWENVVKNFEILGDAIGFDPKKLVQSHQTHTDIVLPVDEKSHGADLFAPALPECDGLITNCPGTALAVFSADCTPILLHDPITGAVGAVHAGWRGTAARIAEKAVRAMAETYGCRPENIHAAIGPNIAQCCFETHRDVPEAMEDAYGEAAKDHIQPRSNKYYVNLKALNTLALQAAGVENIAVSRLCTACDTNRFWSHRVQGQSRGSQGAIILCKEATK